jgi:hypothetical protein
MAKSRPSVWQICTILHGYQLCHNYFRKHEGLEGKTPAEAAGIKIKGVNKWITVIQKATLNTEQS